MKVLTKIGLIGGHEIEANVLKRLLEVCPEGADGSGFMYEAEENDPKLLQVIKTMSESGMEPWERLGMLLPGKYRMFQHRKYQKQDFEKAPYLQIFPRILFQRLDNLNEAGQVELDTAELKKASIAQAGEGIIISNELKSLIESRNFEHIHFQRPIVTGKKSQEYDGFYWHMYTDKVLPPFSKTCNLITTDGKPFDHDYTKVVIIEDGLFKGCEAHYASADIKSMGKFDMAITRELLGTYGRTVVSNRFYAFCKEQKLKIDWVPVRIDP